MKERQKKRGREGETEKERQKDREGETERQKGKDRGTERERERERQRGRERQRERAGEADIRFIAIKDDAAKLEPLETPIIETKH